MIKPFLEPFNLRPGAGPSLRIEYKDCLSTTYHYHEHFELTWIKQGNGERVLGRKTGQFNNGDLVLVGPHLPHCWQTDHAGANTTRAKVISVQFEKDFLGTDFLSKPELVDIRQLLERSKRGIIFDSSLVAELSSELEDLTREDLNFKKLHTFLHILHKLSTTANFIQPNSKNHLPLQLPGEDERITKVFEYIRNNYKTHVSLYKVAEIACMTPQAFCKYFKKATQKTFIEVVTEFRLQCATNQLMQTSKSISQICFDSGFNDIVYFNRVFKSKMLLSPLKYKKKMLVDLETATAV